MIPSSFAMKLAAACLAGALVLLVGCGAGGKGPGGEGDSVDMAIARSIKVEAADEQGRGIVTAAQAFLNTLSVDQRKAVMYDFGDNAQRSRWSNFPASFVDRGGIMRKDLSATQNKALDALLSKVLSEKGARNVRMQLVAEDSIGGWGGRMGTFGSGLYSVSFLGGPSLTAPWMCKCGGHHLAINATLVGAKASFSPMLTGGQPLTIMFEGKRVYITQEEVAAGRALLASLNAPQRRAAVRGGEAINILLGPGQDGTVIAPEGVRGSDLSAAQKQLLLAVIEARVSQFNARDATAKMAAVRAGVNDTWFSWWGPPEPFGAAYFRITGPAIMLEYGPQGRDESEHAHNMYREPTNDYGAAWLKAR